MTRILGDADACPVVRIVARVAIASGLLVTLLYDTNHVLTSNYALVKVIGAGADAEDFVLINLCRCGDVVVTQDYCMDALALGKSAYAINQSGVLYTQDNIDQMLMECHLARKEKWESTISRNRGKQRKKMMKPLKWRFGSCLWCSWIKAGWQREIDFPNRNICR